tara:strand:+ start:821 stop:1090 length:270 start_codon:yes stop_codon:yes gene_type:complete
MIDLTITVTTENDTWSVKPTVGTYVKFERHFNQPVTQLAGSISMEHLCWLAWEQSRHENRPVKPFNEFIETVVNLELGEQADTPLVKEA